MQNKRKKRLKKRLNRRTQEQRVAPVDDPLLVGGNFSARDRRFLLLLLLPEYVCMYNGDASRRKRKKGRTKKNRERERGEKAKRESSLIERNGVTYN